MQTDTLTTARGDRVTYDAHGPVGEATAVVFVAGAGPFRAADPATIALYAATQGLPVAGVVCFEAPLDPATPDVSGWTLETERLLDAGDPEGAVTHYLKDLPPELVGRLRTSPVWPARIAHAPALRADAQALRWALAAPYAEGFGRRLGELGVPVVAAHGTATFPEMPVAARAVADAVPGATVREVAGENHTWDPEAMADLLTEVVRS